MAAVELALVGSFASVHAEATSATVAMVAAPTNRRALAIRLEDELSLAGVGVLRVAEREGETPTATIAQIGASTHARVIVRIVPLGSTTEIWLWGVEGGELRVRDVVVVARGAREATDILRAADAIRGWSAAPIPSPKPAAPHSETTPPGTHSETTSPGTHSEETTVNAAPSAAVAPVVAGARAPLAGDARNALASSRPSPYSLNSSASLGVAELGVGVQPFWRVSLGLTLPSRALELSLGLELPLAPVRIDAPEGNVDIGLTSLRATAAWSLPLTRRWRLWTLASGGAAFVRADGRAREGYLSQTTSTVTAVGAIGGAVTWSFSERARVGLDVRAQLSSDAVAVRVAEREVGTVRAINWAAALSVMWSLELGPP
jgi:hypothetical protein